MIPRPLNDVAEADLTALISNGVAEGRTIDYKRALPGNADADKAPKGADFIHWSELIADAIASGSRMAEVRGYLKSIARSTWQLVSWLTHASNAVRYDGILAVDATYAVLNAYGAALLRYERPAPDRCLRCRSVRIRITDDPEFRSGSAIACESCGAVIEISPETDQQ